MVEDVLYVALVSVGSLKPKRSEESFPAAYALLHQATGKAYVGSTHNLYLRMQQHRYHLKEGDHKNRFLQEAYNESPDLSVRYTKTTSKADAVVIEQRLIDELFPTGNLFNISPDATFANKGVPVSEERKGELRQRTVTQFASQEARDKHSELTKRKWEDPEYRKKQENRTISDEIRLEISRKAKANWANPEYKAKRKREKAGKPITINGVTYPRKKDAALVLGISPDVLNYKLRKGLLTNGKN